jgi:molybdate transport system ATP-binding protein
MDAGRVVADGPLADVLARLDLPLPVGEDAGVVLDAVVAERDALWHLARLEQQPILSARDMFFNGGAAPVRCSFWTRDTGAAVGQRVRLRVLARDVSLTLAPQSDSSIGNQLSAVVEAVADDRHPALALVRVRVGTTPLVARLSKRSANSLGLHIGQTVWAQVKTVALME